MRYKEEISFFSKTFFFIVGIVIAAGLWMQMAGIGTAVPAIFFALLFVLLFGRLLITVSGGTLSISFGYLGIIRKEISLSDIREARVVEYRPLRQFGGWGIRSGTFDGKRTGCYSMKGNKGLLLSLNHAIRVCCMKTDRVIVGCENPEKLRASLYK